VQDAAVRAVAMAREGRPVLLEAVSGRLRGHSVVDPAAYRSKAPEPSSAIGTSAHLSGNSSTSAAGRPSARL